MKLDEMFVPEATNASEFLSSHTGRYFLFNIERRGRRDAACLNVEGTGSAACRFLDSKVPLAVSIDAPDFKITPETIYMPYRTLNMLANYFEAFRCMIPTAALSRVGRVSVGQLSRDSDVMGSLLETLQDKTEALRVIYDSLKTNIDTPIYRLRKDTKNPVVLASDSELSNDGRSLLNAYSHSLHTYSRLPELCGFGNENASRGKDEPNKRDARLRYWMHEQRKQGKRNPLKSKYALDFVAHELKPLNIAGRNMKWNCNGNPRTDSIDLLLDYEGTPVVTEVKMAGDKFLSVAAVQLWYYAAVLASESQCNRLSRWFAEFSDNKKPWVGLLAESRDERRSNERGFSDDLETVLHFLGNSETKNVMGQRFAGAFVVIVEENHGGFSISGERVWQIKW